MKTFYCIFNYSIERGTVKAPLIKDKLPFKKSYKKLYDSYNDIIFIGTVVVHNKTYHLYSTCNVISKSISISSLKNKNLQKALENIAFIRNKTVI